MLNNIFLLIIDVLFFFYYIVLDIGLLNNIFFVLLFLLFFKNSDKEFIFFNSLNFIFFKQSFFISGRTIIRRYLNSYHKGYERNKQKITKNLSEDIKNNVEKELLLQKKISGNHPTIKTVVEDINTKKYFISVNLTSSEKSNVYIANFSENKKSYIFVNKKDIYSFPLTNKKDVEVAKVILKLNPEFKKIDIIKEKMKSQKDVNKYVEKKMTEQLGLKCKVIDGNLGSAIDNIGFLEKIGQDFD